MGSDRAFPPSPPKPGVNLVPQPKAVSRALPLCWFCWCRDGASLVASHKGVQSWRAGLGRELLCCAGGRGWLGVGQGFGIQGFVPALAGAASGACGGCWAGALVPTQGNSQFLQLCCFQHIPGHGVVVGDTSIKGCNLTSVLKNIMVFHQSHDSCLMVFYFFLCDTWTDVAATHTVPCAGRAELALAGERLKPRPC